MRKLDHDRERLKIAETAARLIARDGIRQVTVADVARELDSTRGKILHYFSSARDVIDAACEWASRRGEQRLELLLSGAEAIQGEEAVVAELLPLDADSDVEWKVRLAWLESVLASQERVQQWQQMTDRRLSIIEQLFEHLQQQGTARQDIPARIAAMQIYDLMMGLGWNLLYYPLEQRRQRAEGMFYHLRSLRAQKD